MAEQESKRDWQFNFLMNSGRTVTQEVELSEEHTAKEACEFIMKQLERGMWWSLDDDLVIRTDRVETFFVGDLEREEEFLNKDDD
ncbi:hypothetical protein GCM10007216_07000 [Thalassobacillus devorans]|uniref:Uncharacterized protein n=1 Tax=Thalassobacillus devorans TaxID=279813 RepID=A0ABQ1NSP1_9BACI|nr:hypothetical protein [Thalassobacillus devorans]NIK27611.1 hypothetical protein [Thalassobacillus devorans]GGC79143.1 hypothetical protein GCM10007216_07000 [Thalassobacillus devorans]